MGKTGGEQKTFSAIPGDYNLLEEIGYGASATVYRAMYIPFNQVVAVKCLDLDRCNSNLDDIRREAQTMSLIDHPNVIRAYCSFVVDHNLWVVMPFMAQGSCLHLMKTAHPDGIEEPAICSVLKETLKAIKYLHHQGHIHRDVKAGNILLDSNGEVKLADFGVSACMFDAGERRWSRNTFAGTPCWMAPEVLQPGCSYNSKADIWSFGITALELAHGHAPFSKYPPMKVLLLTIQNAPPGLDYDRDKKFSKLFKEMIAMCLVKDQTKRPTAEKLLKHPFFKNAKPPEVSLKKLFTDLRPLWQRVKDIQLKDAAQLALKRMPSAEQEALSQSEYQRGVSAWNFDIEDLKAQALLLRDDNDNIQDGKDGDKSSKESIRNKDGEKLSTGNDINPAESQDNIRADEYEGLSNKGKILESGMADSSGNENLGSKNNGVSNDTATPAQEKGLQAKFKVHTISRRQSYSGPLMPYSVLNRSTSESSYNPHRGEIEMPTNEKLKSDSRRVPSFSGPLMLPNRASANSLSAPIKSSGGFRDSLDEKSKANLVQIKGRFSVTSESLDFVKDIPLNSVQRRSHAPPLKKSASVGEWVFEPKQMTANLSINELSNASFPASSLTPHLQNLFQQTALQQELIASMLNSLQPIDADGGQIGKLLPVPPTVENNGAVDPAVAQRERLLLIKVSELQARTMNLAYELTTEKVKYMQLQQQLNTLSSQENGELSEGDA